VLESDAHVRSQNEGFMTPFVLVALDIGDTSFWALERGLLLSKRNGWQLHAIHVVEKGTGAEELYRMEQQLHALIEERFPSAGVQLAIQVGTPAKVVDELASKAGCLLVVVGASERSFMGARMFGKTAEQILSAVSKPVLFVHREPKGHYHRVVAAVDFELSSLCAMREALRLGLMSDSIHLIHALPKTLPTITAVKGSDAATITGGSEGEVSLRFTELLRDLNLDTTRARVEKREGPAFTVISNFVDETHPDLIVLGCFGKKTPRRRAIGSTATGLLHKAPADVFVAKEPSQ